MPYRAVSMPNCSFCFNLIYGFAIRHMGQCAPYLIIRAILNSTEPHRTASKRKTYRYYLSSHLTIEQPAVKRGELVIDINEANKHRVGSILFDGNHGMQSRI